MWEYPPAKQCTWHYWIVDPDKWFRVPRQKIPKTSARDKTLGQNNKLKRLIVPIRAIRPVYNSDTGVYVKHSPPVNWYRHFTGYWTLELDLVAHSKHVRHPKKHAYACGKTSDRNNTLMRVVVSWGVNAEHHPIMTRYDKMLLDAVHWK